jgi:hypothetical protein
MEFKNIAELYDYIDREARKRVERILNDLGKGGPHAG